MHNECEPRVSVRVDSSYKALLLKLRLSISTDRELRSFPTCPERSRRRSDQRELRAQALRRPQLCISSANRSLCSRGVTCFPGRPLSKNSPLDCFLDSPLAEGFSRKSVSRSAERDQRLCLWKLPPLKRRAKLCRSVSHEFLPGASYEASLCA